MAEAEVISVETRKETGSRAARRLRSEGKIPAVVYGHKEEVLSITVPSERVAYVLRHGAHGLLSLDLSGRQESVIIKDLQWDVFGREVLHVDFARVSRDEKITVEVPIVLKGNAPGTSEGGVLDQPMHVVEIRCSASEIQESIVVSISKLHRGESIHVRDLEVRPGTEILADPDQLVVQVAEPKTDAGEGAEDAEAAEPELIRREKEEGEGEGA